MGNHSISKQFADSMEDALNSSRNGSVKIIPPPPGYKPPANIKHKYFKHPHRINENKIY